MIHSTSNTSFLRQKCRFSKVMVIQSCTKHDINARMGQTNNRMEQRGRERKTKLASAKLKTFAMPTNQENHGKNYYTNVYSVQK